MTDCICCCVCMFFSLLINCCIVMCHTCFQVLLTCAVEKRNNPARGLFIAKIPRLPLFFLKFYFIYFFQILFAPDIAVH